MWPGFPPIRLHREAASAAVAFVALIWRCYAQVAKAKSYALNKNNAAQKYPRNYKMFYEGVEKFAVENKSVLLKFTDSKYIVAYFLAPFLENMCIL